MRSPRTPWVRPSSVWNGMNDSGTNSVNPPVRSCSSRTTRMCSASSHGSSMWPNITVTVERMPSAWEASMISTQRATGQLVRRDPLAHAVVQHLGGRPRRRAEPGLAQSLEHLRAARGPTDVAHVRDLHRRVRVQVQLRRRLPWPPAATSRSPRAPQSGWMPGLHADLGRAELDRLLDRGRRTPPRSARRRRASAATARSRRTRSRPCRCSRR